MRVDWLEKLSSYFPAKVAMREVETGRSLTYLEFHHCSCRMAALLTNECGLTYGDRIAILAENSLDHFILLFAAQKTGLILVPINYRLSPHEIAPLIEDCSPSLLIVQEKFKSALSALKRPVPHIWDLVELEQKGYNTKQTPAYYDSVEVNPSDPVLILYTAGTTGTPKGVLYSHNMLFWNSINTSLRINLSSEDRTLTFLPLFHTGGMNVVATPFLHHGGFVALFKKFDAERVTELLEKERITIFMGVPTTLKMMALSNAFSSVSLKTIRFAMVGGEPMPLPLIEEWHKKGVWIRQGFGMTEAGPNLFSLHQDDAVRKIGSIGLPNFYVEARIVDDHGNDVPRGDSGELVFRGPVVTAGYWNNPKATEDTFKDGWFYTGDIVRQDEDGFYYVIDRKKSMFISGGENVYPAEIETVLYRHPGIEEVAVIGIPDERWGEVGKACIVPKKGVSITHADIAEFCADKLAKYKIPKQVECFDALPKSDAGKINKRALLKLHCSLNI